MSEPNAKKDSSNSPTEKANGEINTAEKPAAQLTAEEQMALYEKSLKKDDWGHQPC